VVIGVSSPVSESAISSVNRRLQETEAFPKESSPMTPKTAVHYGKPISELLYKELLLATIGFERCTSAAEMNNRNRDFVQFCGSLDEGTQTIEAVLQLLRSDSLLIHLLSLLMPHGTVQAHLSANQRFSFVAIHCSAQTRKPQPANGFLFAGYQGRAVGTRPSVWRVQCIAGKHCNRLTAVPGRQEVSGAGVGDG
jgi:hypothetical protein